MRITGNKVFWGIVCIVLAAVIAFGVLPMFFRQQSKTAPVVRLTQNVPEGTVLTASMLTEAEAGAFGLPDGVVAKQSDAVGKIAAADLYAGEFLWQARIEDADEYRKQTDSRGTGLSGGMCLVTLELPKASSGAAGILRAGDFVDVYETGEDDEQNTVTEKRFGSLYVYDVLNRNLESLHLLDAQKEQALEDADTNYDFEPAYVVIRCTESQAKTLIRLEWEKSFHMTLKKMEGS